MRAAISLVVAVVLFASVGYIAFSGGIVWSDYWTGLAVTLTATALGVLGWGFKPKINKLLRRTDKHGESEAPTALSSEAEPLSKMRKPESQLLPDVSHLTKLNIDSRLLDKIYEEAHHAAHAIYDDAQLTSFSVLVIPFLPLVATVSIHFRFYSKWADRTCTFSYDDNHLRVEHLPPDKPATSYFDRQLFNFLPWQKSPHWTDFLEKAYSKIGPLPRAEDTKYTLSALAYLNKIWQVAFEDGVNGNEYIFEWNGRELDENGIKRIGEK